MHGTRTMSWQEIRSTYGREVVSLRNEGRWVSVEEEGWRRRV
jgi:hypothetical protein